MLLTDRRIQESLIETLERLQLRSDIPTDVAYDLNVAATALRHSQHIDISDGNGLREYCSEAIKLLQAMRKNKAVSGQFASSVQTLLDDVIRKADHVIDSPLTGNQLKQVFIEFLIDFEAKLGQIAVQAPDIATPLFAGYARELLAHHNRLGMFGKDGVNREAEVSSGEPLSPETLGAYLQQQLDDPTVVITNLNTLSGGFGKETTLFTLKSKSLSADLVMRRDPPLDPCGGLDCHTADKEFPLLKTVFKLGFPAPEPLWQENSSEIIKGPSFTIMRRAPGAVAGDATGGQGKVSADLQRTLAQVTASLHNLPPLPELANISAFAPALWDKSAHDCARAYINAWYEQYLRSSHLPLPAVHGLFNWMIAHVPETDEPSALVHGDIGFHNLLFNEGQLSAVLDWEFAHIGDPAEDVGYIRSVMGPQLDWPKFIDEYARAGRPIPSEERVRFFEIWSHVRNVAGSLISTDHFQSGRFRHIKFGMILYRFVPHFITQAETLISNYERP
jgi:aminoglycoside phosphotransferase (APT) family kinase protein